jgi:hypothetical protein
MLPAGSRTSRLASLQLALLLFGAALLQAQQQPAATVTFDQTFPRSEPEHYVISVGSDCRGAYESNGKLTPQSEGDDSFHFEFTVSPPTCTKIFDLAKQAKYFEGGIDSKKKNLALTGIKTLAYKDAQKSTKATYNYSLIPSVQELTAVFQGLSSTLEFGRRLEFEHHYQKLALDEEMKRMEDSATGRGLEELSAIEAILRKIADDPSLMKVVRFRAEHLLSAGAK